MQAVTIKKKSLQSIHQSISVAASAVREQTPPPDSVCFDLSITTANSTIYVQKNGKIIVGLSSKVSNSTFFDDNN